MNHNHETTLRVSRDLAVSRNVMVAAKHPLAVRAALDILDFDMDIQSACEAPLVDCSGPELLADSRIPSATRDRLREMGHDVIEAEIAFAPRAFASPTGVTVDPATGLRYGGADPFGIGIAAGR